MSPRILVTGATGKVGRHLVQQLSQAGQTVRAGAHSPHKAGLLAAPGVEVVPFDFDDDASLRAALQGIETLVLITPPDARQVDWAIRTLDLAKAAGVKRVVRMSVLAAAMEPGIRLGRWHRTVERYLQGSGLEWTIVRPGPFMQNFLGMYPRGEAGFALPVGAASVNHIHVEDVARALSAVTLSRGHAGKVYMVTGSQPLPLRDAVERLSQDFRRSTPAEAREAWLESGRPAWFVEVLLELFAAFDTGAVGMETSTLEDLTGSKARGFEAFAEEQAA